MNNYLYPLIAIRINGYTEVLNTYDDVLAFIKKNGRFSDRHVEWYYYHPELTYRKNYNNWIVRDDNGCVVKYDDVCYKYDRYHHWNRNNAKVRAIAAKGLPIPCTGCSKAGWKMNHTAKKNSGAGHRNRNRALAIYEAKEYNVKNNVGNHTIPWE